MNVLFSSPRALPALAAVITFGSLLSAAGCQAPGPTGANVVGAEGGVVEVEGVTLTIPPGALSSETAIEIMPMDAPPATVALAQFHRFEPDGLVFDKPVQVRLALEVDPEVLHVKPGLFWSKPGAATEFEEIAGATRDGTDLVGEINHFSGGGAAASSSCDTKPDCECRSYAPHGQLLCQSKPTYMGPRPTCACESTGAGVTLCPHPWPDGTDCGEFGTHEQGGHVYEAGKDGDACTGFEYAVMTPVLLTGAKVGCDSIEAGSCAQFNDYKLADAMPCKGFAGFNDGNGGTVYRELPGRAECPGTKVTEQVTCWPQVNQLNCRMKKGIDTNNCTGDECFKCTGNGDCEDGDVCDTASSCGCCVSAPPPAITAPVRSKFSKCEDNPDGGRRCALPDYSECTSRTATEATCTFNPAFGNWSAEGTPSSIASAEVSLCLAHDPDAKCMWSWDVEPGTIVPYTGVNGTYECGGKTCNGVPTNQVMHVGGQEYTLRVTEDGCSGAP